MKGKLLLWFKGSVRIRILGEHGERFLNLCAYHEIQFWNLVAIPGGYEASLSRRNFKRLKPLVKKCGVRIVILHKSGVPFVLFRYRKRKALFLSLTAAAFFLLSLSLFIWDIEIEGNLSVTDEKVIDYLYGQGIHQGIRKTSLDYRQLASQLRQYFPEITWVSVKLKGTRLLIDLKENEDRLAEGTDNTEPGNIVSDVEGTVVRMITRAGTPMVSAGMEIKKGDLLVSGVVELVNDSGEVYDRQLVAADADIYVSTFLDYEDTVLLKQEKKVYTGKKKSRGLLRIGNLRIGIPFFQIPYETYDTVSDTKQFRIMENFYLPVFFSSIEVREYRSDWTICTYEQAQRQLNSNLERFLEKIEEKGVQIFENNVKIEKTVSMCRAKGRIYFVGKAGQRTDIALEQQQEGTLTE